MNLSAFTFGITLLLASLNSFAGVKEVGNGGVAIVCRHPVTGGISEAFLLDLFEAENLGRTITRSSEPESEQMAKALRKLDASYGIQYEITRQLRIVKSEATFLQNRRVGLILTDDTLPRLRQKGCEYEQLATYFEEENAGLDAKGLLKIDQEIYDSLSPTDQAALWLHETLYKIDRRLNKARTSVQARDLTGALFSDLPTESIVELFTRVFGYYRLGDNTVWLDPNKGLELKVTSDVPAKSQCHLTMIAGPILVDSEPFFFRAKMKDDWAQQRGAFSSSMNGEQIGPLGECWMDGKPRGNLFLELIQDGKTAVTIEFKDFTKSSPYFSQAEAKTIWVLHPDGRRTRSLTWRFL